MLPTLSLGDLMDYTAWERQKWHDWFRQQGDPVLKISAGPHGDGRFETVGDLVRHIFSAEIRYIERLSDRPLTDPASIPVDNIDALFQFGHRSREALKEFVQTLPAQEWGSPREYKMMNSLLIAAPRKFVVHVLTHEIRHWAQIASLLRLNGLKGEFHDFLISPVLGGEVRRSQEKG